MSTIKGKVIKCIAIVAFVFLVNFIYRQNVFAEQKTLDNCLVDYKAIGKYTSQEKGIGKDAIIDAAKSGVLSKEFYSSNPPKAGEPLYQMTHGYSDNLVLRPGYLYDTKRKPSNEYSQALYNLYSGVIDEMEASGEYNEYFSKACR